MRPLILLACLPLLAAADLDPKLITVTASAFESKAHGGWGDFPPGNVLDGKLEVASSWRAEGKGQWIQFDLGAERRLAGMRAAFVSGDKRIYTYDLQVSATGTDGSWTTVAEQAKSSGTTAGFEALPLKPVTTRFVRLVGHGNNSEKFPAWINLCEVAFALADAP